MNKSEMKDKVLEIVKEYVDEEISKKILQWMSHFQT